MQVRHRFPNALAKYAMSLPSDSPKYKFRPSTSQQASRSHNTQHSQSEPLSEPAALDCDGVRDETVEVMLPERDESESTRLLAFAFALPRPPRPCPGPALADLGAAPRPRPRPAPAAAGGGAADEEAASSAIPSSASSSASVSTIAGGGGIATIRARNTSSGNAPKSCGLTSLW